jgi:hypothetical protein
LVFTAVPFRAVSEIVIGAVLQALGFLVLVYDLHVVRRREGRTVAPFVGLRKLFAGPKEHVIEHVDFAGVSDLKISGFGVERFSRDMKAATGEERIEFIVANLESLEATVQKVEQAIQNAAHEVEKNFEERDAKMAEIETNIAQDISERGEAEMSVRSDSDGRQAFAAILFVLGLAFTTLGSV